MPASEIAQAAARVGAHAVALSIVYPLDDPGLGVELAELRSRFGPGTIFVGGRGAKAYSGAITEIGAFPIDSLEEFVGELDRLATG